MDWKKKLALLFLMIIISTLLYFYVLNIYNNNIIAENKKKLDDRRILGKNLLLSIYNNEFKKYDQNFNKTLIVKEYGQKIFDKIFNKILKEKKIINSVNKILTSDNLILLNYDKFIEKVILEGLDPYSEVVSSLYNEINIMKNTANDEYKKIYDQNNIIFPFVIGPLHKININKLRQTIEKVILDYINNNINNFINNFDTNQILKNPKYNTFIDNYIISEDKIKPFIIELLIEEYNLNIVKINYLLTNNENIIINNLCTNLGGKNVDNMCSYGFKDCKQMFLDSSNNIFKNSSNNIFKDSSNNDISNNIFNDLSNNIFTTYKKDSSNNDLSNNDLSNNKCLISAQSVLHKYVSNNNKNINNDINIKNSNSIIVSNNDISYDFENEKVNLTTDYCKKKGLETTKDSDCKLTKNKSMLESVFGVTLLDSINTININNYEQCNINDIDGNKTNIIPNDLKELIKPLTKKYGPIEKSLCFDKNYGCPPDKKLVNAVCYNKCQDGYLENPDKKSECYKLYATFENNGEFKNTDIITKKIINNPYLPKNVCPPGYNYNAKETTGWECIENCPNDYTYQVNSNCKKNDPVRWDGAKDHLSIKKNAIWSQSKVRVFKPCKDPKPDNVDGLCYAKCPPGHVRVPGAPYTCRPEPCPEGYHKTGVNTCYRHPDTKLAWYTKGAGIGRWVCPAGHVAHLGTCWEHNYDRGAGRWADKHGCAPGQRDDGTACWEDWKCNTWDEGKYNYTWGIYWCWDGVNGHWWHGRGDCYRTWIANLKTSCTGCGCKKKEVWDRYYCRSGEVLRGALCYPACAPGYEEATVTNCRFVGNHDNTRASCPSDRDEIDGMCYPKCNAGYWSSGITSCETNNCPSGYYKTKLATCQLDAHTIPNPNIGAGESTLLCPEGTKEATPGGICYPDPPPVGYQRSAISIEQWTEKCPDGWADKGWSCERPFKDVNKLNSACPSNYNDIGNGKCKKECEPGYEFKDEKCVQICPEGTINNNTTCKREKKIINTEEYTMPYKYKIKKRKK
jgi:hypothetical protein